MWEKIEILSSLEKIEEDYIYTTVLGTLGLALSFESIDLEIIEDELLLKSFKAIFSKIDPELRLKFISKSYESSEDFKDLSRTKFLQELKFRKTRNFLLIETKLNLFSLGIKNEFFEALKSLPFSSLFLSLIKESKLSKLEKIRALGQRFKDFKLSLGSSGETKVKIFKPAGKEEIESLFLNIGTEIIRYPDHLVIDQKLYGIVRIKTNTSQSLSFESLVNLRNELEFDHEVTTNLKRVYQVNQELLMNHLKSEGTFAQKLSDLNRKEEIEELEDELLNQEASLFEVEVLIKVQASCEKTLRQRLLKISVNLEKEFGSSYIENLGIYPSFVSSLIGTEAHVSFKELSSGLLYYCPLFENQNFLQQEKSSRSLRLHRRGDHLQSIELISNLYQSGNTMIVGPKGSGKSVLCGLISQSLLNDPSALILKMDVGSSYVRECEKFGGQRFGLELNQPSGLNPLEVLAKTPYDLEIAQIVTDFIEVLVSKDQALGGNFFGIIEEERVSLENLVKEYSLQRPRAPSLDDFFLFATNHESLKLPNHKLFVRWIKGGMFENIFKPLPSTEMIRYRYYDFKSVNNASNPYLVRGAVAAVMAQYNSEVAISGRNGPRIFLFCDETTEFLNLCAPFFISTAKNSRKFGHATILINQESASFQVQDRKGVLSNSLFENTDHHFLFSYPNDPDDIEKFKARHKLSSFEYSGITKLQYQKGLFSEVFYKTRLGGQTLRIKLTAEEYWLLTSDKEDFDKLDHLQRLGFTKEEAMGCLRQLHSKLY